MIRKYVTLPKKKILKEVKMLIYAAQVICIKGCFRNN